MCSLLYLRKKILQRVPKNKIFFSFYLPWHSCGCRCESLNTHCSGTHTHMDVSWETAAVSVQLLSPSWHITWVYSYVCRCEWGLSTGSHLMYKGCLTPYFPLVSSRKGVYSVEFCCHALGGMLCACALFRTIQHRGSISCYCFCKELWGTSILNPFCCLPIVTLGTFRCLTLTCYQLFRFLKYQRLCLVPWAFGAVPLVLLVSHLLMQPMFPASVHFAICS